MLPLRTVGRFFLFAAIALAMAGVALKLALGLRSPPFVVTPLLAALYGAGCLYRPKVDTKPKA